MLSDDLEKIAKDLEGYSDIYHHEAILLLWIADMMLIWTR